MKTKIKTWLKIGHKKRVLAIKAFGLCGIARAAILLIPFKKVKPYLGAHNQESPQQVDSEVYTQAREIKWAVETISRYTPWESKCLVQAIVAQHLLKKKHIPTTLYLGVSKDQQGELKAHAWLRCGEMIVTGGRMKAGYTQVSKFASIS